MAVPYRYDLGFKVNGTPIPDPMEFGGSSGTLDTAAGRDATGHLHRSPVAVKNPLKIGWSNVDWEMITRIMRLVVATNFSFTYPDPTAVYGSYRWYKIKGATGEASTFTISSTQTLAPDEPAFAQEVSGSTPQARIYTLGVPKGDKGEKGDKGDQGIQGEQGIQGNTGSGMRILARRDTLEEVENDFPERQIGDQFEVGTSVPYAVYLWTDIDGSPGWINQGTPVTESPPASDIPTSAPGVSVQDALDFQSEAIQALKGQTAIEILATTLLQDAWTQDENSGIFEQSISNILFAAEDYSYHMAVAPGDIFAAADLGGIVMASVADGSAIFQCRSQPEADIAIQIERTPRKDGA